ncbi:Pimeloyl-ACP methyl ester carboxylesterase [Clostridium cavendishii DSM 21758]|uniref:prolyl aminopeptidase n=1 Tax=Clostridium cavendishii DSM 21758 TaxID=1121302 RepID=A0A1M6HX04_9CLOT|nr:alpha/beta hydrolase [Clostridium cavendishii]SHJ26594.1 Pimeloyl-ACP methyl ester carboxylesterase [Clostridium cavendishii DSM 21758]
MEAGVKENTNKQKRNYCIRKWIYVFISAIITITIYIALIRPHLTNTMIAVKIELAIAGVLIIAFIISIIIILITLIFTAVTALRKKKRYRIKIWGARLKKQTIFLLITTVLIGLATVGSQQLVYTPAILGADGKVIPNSIAKLEKVNINGKNEWISIRGKSTDKPLLLFLAGGPGGTQMAATRDKLKDLEEHFIVVNWDQPGSGKSYNAVSSHTELSTERYVSDAYELTKYLCKKFNKDKIYVVGESWGSALGILLAQKHPELFYAFIGTGQMVDFKETEKLDYNFVLKLAKERNDNKLIKKLETQGPPPYYEENALMKQKNYLMYITNYMVKNPAISNSNYNTFSDIAGPEYGLYDKVNYFRGLVKSMNNFYPKLYDVDFRKQAKKIDVPVYFFEGRHDVNAPTELAEEYYNLLNAPSKKNIWFEHSGHDVWRNEPEKFIDTLVNIVLKETGNKVVVR